MTGPQGPPGKRERPADELPGALKVIAATESDSTATDDNPMRYTQ